MTLTKHSVTVILQSVALAAFGCSQYDAHRAFSYLMHSLDEPFFSRYKAQHVPTF